jgi:hypothetical protein
LSGGSGLIPSGVNKEEAPVETQKTGVQNQAGESWVEFRENGQPYLNARASLVMYRVALSDDPVAKDRRIYITARGPLEEAKLEFYAEPAMSQRQIFSLLNLGEDMSGGAADGGRALTLLLGRVLAGGGSKIVRNIFPVDSVNVKIGPAMLGHSGALASLTPGMEGLSPTSGAATGEEGVLGEVEVGKELGKGIYATYHGKLQEKGLLKEQEFKSEGGVEYRKGNKKVSLYGDDNGAVRVGIEASAPMDNYNPKKRRQQLKDLANAAPTIDPTPTPTPLPPR